MFFNDFFSPSSSLINKLSIVEFSWRQLTAILLGGHRRNLSENLSFVSLRFMIRFIVFQVNMTPLCYLFITISNKLAKLTLFLF